MTNFTLKAHEWLIELPGVLKISRGSVCFKVIIENELYLKQDLILDLSLNQMTSQMKPIQSTEDLKFNEEQERAINAIVASHSRSIPFLLFGPPGKIFQQIFTNTFRFSMLLCILSFVRLSSGFQFHLRHKKNANFGRSNRENCTIQ